MKFFDFHTHPTLKPTFMNQETQLSPWQHVAARLQLFGLDVGINGLFNETLNSQCNLAQMMNGGVKLFGIALHAPESNMAVGLLQKKPISKGAIPLLNNDRLQLIASGDHYFELINDELERLAKPAPDAFENAACKLLQNTLDFNENDDKTINAFLVVEGLHCFMGKQSDANADEVFLANFEAFTDKYKVIAINVCHLQQAPFCNHAFGIQFLNVEFFYATGNGFTDRGWQMVQRMMQKNILVDIKHMSLFTRLQLYSRLKDDNDGNYPAPIICTHAGLTGISWNDRLKYLYQPVADKDKVYEVTYLKPRSPHLPEAYFNCSSINLYNEDIEAILISGGLIGISFDQRILGFADENVLKNVTQPHDLEYISKGEAGFFLGPNPTHLPVYQGNDDIWLTEDFENYESIMNVIVHAKLFVNHVLHILFVANSNEAIGMQKAMKQICLGSDYDGLINAIDNCKNSGELFKFHQYFVDNFKGFYKKAGFKEDINVEQFAEDLFYNNGRNFVLKRLAVMA